VYALDTNTVIDFFRGAGRVAERLLATPPGDVAIPAVVLYELEVGIARAANAERRREQLRELSARAALLPFRAPEAEASARLRTELERRGEPIGPLDTLIAGTALARGAILVTHNTREFGRVPGLRIEDWF
jgi:tRNA(fMet)-specific endonuclease VapC